MNRDTICVQGGYTPGNGELRQIPIIQSTTFKYASSEMCQQAMIDDLKELFRDMKFTGQEGEKPLKIFKQLCP